MGIKDFNNVFDQLDSAQRGFVTADQIMDFYALILETDLKYDILNPSIEKVCGTKTDRVTKEFFFGVVEEIQRQNNTDTEAYWDFQALDTNGDNHIPLTSAFLLFQEYHADHFSLDTWHQFLQSREYPGRDVFYDEIRYWLCHIPPKSKPCPEKKIRQEEKKLEKMQLEHELNELDNSKFFLANEELDNEQQERDNEETQYLAKRKLNLWKTHGLEAMLNDDGRTATDMEGERVKHRDGVSTNDVLDALEMKYSMLQDKIIIEMAAFEANMDSEKAEVYEQIKRAFSKMTKDRTLQDRSHELQGSRVALPMTLIGLLGDLRDADTGRKNEFESMQKELEGSGKSSSEIFSIVASKYQSIVDGSVTCGSALAQLSLRHKAEREVILSSLQSGKSSVPSTVALAREYWHLLHQLRLLKAENGIVAAGLSVGIAERTQAYKPIKFDWDRQRSESLADLRLELRRGHKPIRRSTAPPDIESLKEMKSMNLKIRLIEEMDQRHFHEREAMINFLQGPDSKKSVESAFGKSQEERKRRLRTLRNQRVEWKSANSSDLEANQKILFEAIGLYYEERHSEIEATKHNAGDDVIKAAILADLHQRQEQEFRKMIEEVDGKKLSEMQTSVLTEIEMIKDEHFDNIAFVVLGCVEVSADDNEYIQALDGKYMALRDQVFIFGIRDRMGSAWQSMSKEERQKEILKLRKEEQRLRGEGEFHRLDSLIGPRSQAMYPLNSLIGEDKVFITDSPRPPHNAPAINILADMVPRYDHEQESLLSWLHSDEAKSMRGKVRRIHITRMVVEKFAASTEGDYETAMLSVGLLERISSSLTGRSKSDKDRQLNLAKKRAALCQTAMTNHGKMRAPADEKASPKDDDDTGWQAVYVRALMRRHYKEREVMLKLLLGPGLDEIVEAASILSPNEARVRIKELQGKRDELNFEEPDTQEEHLDILEEAGAIRVAGKKQALCKARGKAVLLEEVVHLLLSELQDMQDMELAQEMNGLSRLDAKDMQMKAGTEDKAKTNSHCDLVMKVFSKYDGDTTTSAFEKIIEQKYRNLRMHLLNESLLQQHGVKAWTKMGQKQKFKLLEPLLKKEESLWKEGNNEMLSGCFNSDFVLSPFLPFLTGMGRQQYTTELGSENSLIIEAEEMTADSSGKNETFMVLHNRYSSEIDFVRNYISGSLNIMPSSSEKSLLFQKLKWEATVTENIPGFVGAALVCGLAERQNVECKYRLQHDKQRYHLLASQIIKSNRDTSKHSLQPIKSEDISKVQEAVIATLMAKHTDEWNVFSKLFSSSKFKNVHESVLVETLQQRSDRLSALFKKRESFGIKKTSDQLAVLEEAVIVKKEIRRDRLVTDDGVEVKDDSVLSSLFSDLLQAQLCEAQVYLQGLVNEKKEDIEESQASLLVEISESHVTNVVEVIFASEGEEGESDSELSLKAAVDGKYNAMHDQLLIQALIDEMGEDEWRRLSEQERRRRLLELKLKERRLRKEGKMDEANALLGGLLNDEERLRQILGDNKEEMERKLKERLERRKQRLAEGMTEEECDELEAQEIVQEEEEERQKRKNILLYLEDCSEKEKEELLRKLREMEDEAERQRLKRIEMLRLQREERRLRQENKFDSAAMLLNMCKDTEDRFKLSHDEERKRQRELAKRRLEEARQRRMQGENLVRGESIVVSDDDEQDEGKLDESVVKLLDSRHQAERYLLGQLIDEASEGEARDEVRIMTDDELKQQIQETEELFIKWRESENSSKDDGRKIFAEATALSIEAKKRDMQAEGELASDEDVKVEMMADLQMKQDQEASQMMQELADADIDRKKAHLQSQRNMLNRGIYNNIANVLFELANQKDIFSDGENKESQEEEDTEVVNALEKKYDAMKDKLIMEALMKEMGENDWNRLSALEKQKKILALKREERRLRKEGKNDEAAALLGQYLDQISEISRLLGESEAETKKRLQEKLELKRKLKAERESQGLEVDEETLDNLAEEEVNKKKRNILENLDFKLEEEKAALLASLKNQTDQLLKEKERQLSLAKLKREQKRLKQAEKFDSAAMIFALHQETNEKMEQHILNERERNRQLAKERLEARKRLKAEREASALAESEKGEVNTDIKDEGVYLQDCIINTAEKHHDNERDSLAAMLDGVKATQGDKNKFENVSDQNLKAEFTKLQKDLENWVKSTMKVAAKLKKEKLASKKKEKLEQEQKKRNEQLRKILDQTMAVRFELERRKIQASGKQFNDEELLQEFSISLMTMVQMKQASHLESISDSMGDKSEEDLRNLLHMQDLIAEERWFQILSTSLFSSAFDLEEQMDIKEESSWITMEEDFEKEKKALVEKGKNDNVDIDALLKDLEEKQNERRKVNASEIQRQKDKLAKRLAQKKEEADDKNFDLQRMTSQLFDSNEANKAALQQTLDSETGRQNDLLQQKLKARREARKRADGKDVKMPSREDTTLAADEPSRRPSLVSAPSPPGRLSRERTQVDVRVSDDQKQAIYDQLVLQEQQRQMQIAQQQSKQQEMLRKRLENRVNKRETEAAALFSLGERQKTILEKSQKDERERQIAQMQERVTRIRESRSKSPKAKVIQEEEE